jgi:hypothetical protein
MPKYAVSFLIQLEIEAENGYEAERKLDIESTSEFEKIGKLMRINWATELLPDYLTAAVAQPEEIKT